MKKSIVVLSALFLLMAFQVGLSLIIIYHKKEVIKKWINRLYYYLSAIIIYGLVVLSNYFDIIDFKEQ